MMAELITLAFVWFASGLLIGAGLMVPILGEIAKRQQADAVAKVRAELTQPRGPKGRFVGRGRK